MMITFNTKKNQNVNQLDVDLTFYKGELKEEVHLFKPKRFVKFGKENIVCKLKKTLY